MKALDVYDIWEDERNNKEPCSVSGTNLGSEYYNKIIDEVNPERNYDILVVEPAGCLQKDCNRYKFWEKAKL